MHSSQPVQHDEHDPRGAGIPRLTAKTGLSNCTRLGGSAIALGVHLAGIQEDASLASGGLIIFWA